MSISMMTPESSTSPPSALPLAPRPSMYETATSPSPPTEIQSNSLSEVISNGAFSKTWILPPRKKPGRKAANDVPPTVNLSVIAVNGRNDKLRIERPKRRSGIARRKE